MTNKGFTLIEMMITVAIAAILVTVVAPDFKGFITNNRLATQVNTFVTALHVARAEAVKRNLAVTLCESKDGKSCNNDKADTQGFEQGWIIFTDQQNPGTVDDYETIITINQGMPMGMSLLCINGETKELCKSPEKRVTYRADGTSIDNMTLRLCQQGSKTGRHIVINITGRARVDPAEYTDCPTG